MRAFVALRKTHANQKEINRKLGDLEQRLGEHDEHIHTIFEALRKLMIAEEKPKKRIGFGVEKSKTKYEKRKKVT